MTRLILVTDCCDNCPKCLWVCHTLNSVPSKDSDWLHIYYPALPLVLSACGLMLILPLLWLLLLPLCGLGLPYCSPVVCCCKTSQNWFATIKLYCEWAEAVNTNPDIAGCQRSDVRSLSASTCSCRHEHRCPGGSILTSWHWHHSRHPSPPDLNTTQKTPTGHTNGRKGKNIGKNSRNWSMFWCIWSNSRHKRSD